MRLAMLIFCMVSLDARAADEALSFRGNASWINAYEHATVLDDPRNPDNQSLGIPTDRFLSELRPNLKIVSTSLQVVARPRITFESAKSTVAGVKHPYQGYSSNIWSEAFLQWTMSERAALAIGRQNFQWGAAESLSPSNRLVHDTAQNRSVLYEVTGHNLARLQGDELAHVMSEHRHKRYVSAREPVAA